MYRCFSQELLLSSRWHNVVNLSYIIIAHSTDIPEYNKTKTSFYLNGSQQNSLSINSLLQLKDYTEYFLINP